MKGLLRRVVNSGVYQEKNFVDDPFPNKVLAADVWSLMERVIKCMGPLLLLCRLADGQKPVISKLYGTQLYVREQIEQSAATAGTYIIYINPFIQEFYVIHHPPTTQYRTRLYRGKNSRRVPR